MHCAQAKGLMSQQAVVEKGREGGRCVGSSKRIRSQLTIPEESGGVIENQGELLDVLHGIWDELTWLNTQQLCIAWEIELHNNLTTISTFMQGNLSPRPWPRGKFAEWFAEWFLEKMNRANIVAWEKEARGEGGSGGTGNSGKK